MTHDDRRTTLAHLAITPALAAEVDLHHLPEVLGEVERLRAIPWARLTIRGSKDAVSHLVGIVRCVGAIA